MHFIRSKGFRLKTIDKIGASYFVALIGFSLVGTIWAIYLKSFLNNNAYVGFLSAFLGVISFISYFLVIPIIEKYSKTRLLFLSLLVYIVSYLIFSIYSSIYIIIIIGGILSVIGSLRMSIFGIIIRDKSKDNAVSKNEGFIYSFLNLAWFIGPLIAGYISERMGFNFVFFFAALLVLVSATMFKIFNIKDNRVDKKIDYNTLKLFIDFFKDKDRGLVYLVSAATSFWWALIYIYMPLFIIENGFDDFIVGLFVSAVVVPLICCEYYFGKVAGMSGFKNLFFRGYFMLGFIAISCFILTNPAFVITIMILASFGIAMVEATQEAYLFDILKKDERDRFFVPYTTSTDTGHLAATLFLALILLFLPFKFIFLFSGIVMLITSFYSLKIKDVIENKR